MYYCDIMFNPLEGRIVTMTRTVREKAIGLLTKAISDYSGNEKKIADSLLEELRVHSLILDNASSELIEDRVGLNSSSNFGWAVAKSTNQTLH